MLAAECVFANSGRVAIIGHVDWHATARRKFPPDIRTHPVLTEIGAAPDNAFAAGRRHVQANASDGAAVDASTGSELVERVVELAECRFVAIFDQAADLDQRPHLLGVIVD